MSFIPLPRLPLFLALLQLGIRLAAGSSVRCTGSPPRLWRHDGCESWRCGSVGGQYEGCQDFLTGTLCGPEHWNCTWAGDVAGVGDFACVGGDWADLLPLCLGSTSPGAPGTWQTSTVVARAVLFQANITWDSPTSYRLNVCSSFGSESFASCERKGFGEFVEGALWGLVANPLQETLCEIGDETTLGVDSCSSLVSSLGALVRVAGVAGDASGDNGTLVVYMEAVPRMRDDAEQLQSDIASMVAASPQQGAALDLNTLWTRGNPDWGGLAWLEEGFRRLRDSPEDFSVQSDLGFDDTSWLPELRVSITSPYIINRRNVPDWQVFSSSSSSNGGARSADPNEGLLVHVEAYELLAIRSTCLAMVVFWVLLFWTRACCWPILWGAASPWAFTQTVRSLNFVGALTAIVGFANVGGLLAISMHLEANGALNHLPVSDLRRPRFAMLWFLVVFAVLLPVCALSLQVATRIGEAILPKGMHICCMPVRRRTWIRCFAGALVWDLVAMLSAVGYAICRLVLDGDYQPLAQEAAVAECHAGIALQCGMEEGQQLPSFSAAQRSFCATDCEALPLLAEDVLARLECAALRLLLCVGAWEALVRLLQVWIASVLHEERMKISRVPQQSGATTSTIRPSLVSGSPEDEEEPFDFFSLASAPAPNEKVAASQANGKVSFASAATPERGASALVAPSGALRELSLPLKEDEQVSVAQHPGAPRGSGALLEGLPPLHAADKAGQNVLAALSILDMGGIAPDDVSGGSEATSARSSKALSARAPTSAPHSTRSRWSGAQQGSSASAAVAADLLGKERHLMDTAQQVARQASADLAAETESVASGRSGRSSGSGKRRFTAEW